MNRIATKLFHVVCLATATFLTISGQSVEKLQTGTARLSQGTAAKLTEPGSVANKKEKKGKRKVEATLTVAKNAAERQQTKPGDAQELAKQLANPISSLISVPTQINYDHSMGPNGDGSRLTINIQPVVPFSISEKWNLISRTILPIIHQERVAGPTGTQTGIGDIVQSIFFSPKKTTPFIWGAGPVLLLPTATDGQIGSKQFGIGPTIVVLKQQSGWTYGALYNHIWGIAGGSGRPKVNSDFIQPFLAYGTKSGWTFTLNTESTYDWNARKWSVPIHLTASKLVRVGGQPISLQGGLRCWATAPDGGPQGCGPRMAIVFLFPVKH
jgi:hypothetical protein